MSSKTNRMRPAVERLRVRHLRLLELLVEAGSVRKAAELMHISQPAVSQMLKELECAFGGPLFKRSRAGVEANQRVRVLLRRVRAVLGELGAAQGELLQSPRPLLRIGANLQFLTELLPAALRTLRTADPEIRFVVHEAGTERLVEAVLAGELDAAIGRMSRETAANPDLRCTPVHAGELCLVVGHAHALARRRRVSLDDLAAHDWALGAPTGEGRRAVEQLFIREGVPPPQPVVECRPPYAALSLVTALELIAVATRTDAVSAARAGSVRILPIELPVTSTPVTLICRTAVSGDPWLTRLREALTLAPAAP